jgi:hypothetical protein
LGVIRRALVLREVQASEARSGFACSNDSLTLLKLYFIRGFMNDNTLVT